MTELTTIESFQQKIADSVRETVIGNLPDELISSITTTAIDEFINGKLSKRFDRHGNPISSYCAYNDSDTIKGMIWNEIVGETKKLLAAEFAKDEWRQKFTYESSIQHTVIDTIDNIIKNNAGTFVSALVSQIINTAVMQSINNIKSANSVNFTPY